MKFRFLTWALLLLSSSTFCLYANVKLFPLFGDNMVLQRDSSASIWGTADPQDTITLTFGDQKVSATAAADGTWKAAFTGLKVGPPQTLTVTGSHNTITLQNVAVGEVWFTSGQSNMQYKLIDKDEIAASSNPNIRYFESPREMASEPKKEFSPHSSLPWIVAAPENSGNMSAVAYYFAKELTQKLNVPIGIIDCTWGGTPGEAWTSREALDSVPEYKGPIDEAILAFQNQAINAEHYTDNLTQWEQSSGRTDPGNTGFKAGWAAPGADVSGWLPVDVSKLVNWNSAGLSNGGAIWLRKTVTLPPEAVGKDFNLALGSVPGIDTTYFNGEQIGSGGASLPQFTRQARSYKVPGALVKSGDNVIAVRIFTQTSRAGTFGIGSKMGLPVSDPASVSDAWVAHVESQLPPMAPDVLAAMPPSPYPPPGCTPTVNFNGMVCPMTPYSIKGVLWYQGESNATYGYAYRTLLPLLIQSWRTQWGRNDLPFYIVQLPNLGTSPKLPDNTSNWAVVRESQLLTWEKTPNTGMSVNIDVGDPMNLHPPDKKDVGHRLSLIALGQAYHQPVEYSGPVYDSMAVEGNKIRLKFTHIGGGLVAKNGPLKQFAVAANDQKWMWADAVIDGDTVVVSSPDVAVPAAVRYAFTGNPAGCNLYNQADLPASPFRTDDWPVVTQGLWYPSRGGHLPAAK